MHAHEFLDQFIPGQYVCDCGQLSGTYGRIQTDILRSYMLTDDELDLIVSALRRRNGGWLSQSLADALDSGQTQNGRKEYGHATR